MMRDEAGISAAVLPGLRGYLRLVASCAGARALAAVVALVAVALAVVALTLAVASPSSQCPSSVPVPVPVEAVPFEAVPFQDDLPRAMLLLPCPTAVAART